MPGRDGTGPAHAGTGTGTGRGVCRCGFASATDSPFAFGVGRQRRAGHCGKHGRGFAGSQRAATQKKALERQREVLQARMEQIDVQLKNL